MRSRVVERLTDRSGPQTGDQLQLLGEPGESLAQRRKWDRVGQMLLFEPPGADAEFDASTAHFVYLGHRDGQRAGVPERRRGDQRAQPDRRRLAGDAAQRHPGVGRARLPVTAHRQVVVGTEERGKSQRFRRSRDRELVGVTGALLRFNEYPKVHGASVGEWLSSSDEYRPESESV